MIGAFILLISVSCGTREKGLDRLAGGWGDSGDTVVMFTRNDTSMLGVLQQAAYRSGFEYAAGSVLFRDVRKTSDSTFTAKGLFFKHVYRTEQVFVRSFFTFQKDHYETRQVLDHHECKYVDYRLEIYGNERMPGNVVCSRLVCIPFSEGPRWDFIGKVSPEQRNLIEKEKKRIDDSLRIADSISQAAAKEKRRKAVEAQKAKRAGELLK